MVSYAPVWSVPLGRCNLLQRPHLGVQDRLAGRALRGGPIAGGNPSEYGSWGSAACRTICFPFTICALIAGPRVEVDQVPVEPSSSGGANSNGLAIVVVMWSPGSEPSQEMWRRWGMCSSLWPVVCGTRPSMRSASALMAATSPVPALSISALATRRRVSLRSTGGSGRRIGCARRSVSRGGFYAWLIRPRSQRSHSDEELGAKVRASFLGSDRTYGARRVWKDLAAEGVFSGLHRIERLMRLQALNARSRRRRLSPPFSAIVTRGRERF